VISLGFNQYKALEPLYDDGSPVHIESLEPAHAGNIVDLEVTYFAKDRVTQVKAVLTADGDLL
jgi:hypothetical protein